MSEITPNQWTILEALKDGPRWARSFQTVKPLLARLIENGLAERCRPHLGNARNMVRLTLAGCEALEIDPAAVPDRIKREPLPPTKTVNLLPINPSASAKSREICEAFVRAVHNGSKSGEAVGELAARYDVQRPAIWKRLRDGGVIAPYVPKHSGGQGRPVGGGLPGYSEQRRSKSLDRTEHRRVEPSPEQFVSRDPCPRCGVRGDIGCGHSRAPIGMLL